LRGEGRRRAVRGLKGEGNGRGEVGRAGCHVGRWWEPRVPAGTETCPVAGGRCLDWTWTRTGREGVGSGGRGTACGEAARQDSGQRRLTATALTRRDTGHEQRRRKSRAPGLRCVRARPRARARRDRDREPCVLCRVACFASRSFSGGCCAARAVGVAVGAAGLTLSVPVLLLHFDSLGILEERK
jgi:hypothetical protein